MSESFTAADMATAAAQGFRDGVAYVQNMNKNEHVAGDVSKNGAESNMAQQPAPSAAAAPTAPRYTIEDMRQARRESYEQGVASAVPQKVTPAMRAAFREAYKDGSMWTDRLDRAVEAMIAAAPQPSPTPQADSQPCCFGSPELQAMILAKCVEKDRADSQPAPVVDGYAATLRAQNDQFEHALAELVDLVCPGLDSGNLLVDAKTAGDAAQALRAARAPADSVTAPAGGVIAGPVVGYRVSDPHEPDLGHWLSEEPGAAWCVSEPLTLAAAPTPPAQAADSVEHATRRWAAPKYDHQQREWCIAYEAETGFDPMMDDYEAGLKTVAEAAVASWRWYEDHTSDAHLRISRKAIPGGRYDAARKQGANHD